jgi:hypothetical protein
MSVVVFGRLPPRARVKVFDARAASIVGQHLAHYAGFAHFRVCNRDGRPRVLVLVPDHLVAAVACPVKLGVVEDPLPIDLHVVPLSPIDGRRWRVERLAVASSLYVPPKGGSVVLVALPLKLVNDILAGVYELPRLAVGRYVVAPGHLGRVCRVARALIAAKVKLELLLVREVIVVVVAAACWVISAIILLAVLSPFAFFPFFGLVSIEPPALIRFILAATDAVHGHAVLR